MHIIFYDGNCPLCNRVIRFLLSVDNKKVFLFAPLEGKTAKEKLRNLTLQKPKLDSLVLLENIQGKQEKLFIEGRGALRILWILGGKYALIGWLFFLPNPFFDLIYSFIARYRYKIFSTQKGFHKDPNRFLD